MRSTLLLLLALGCRSAPPPAPSMEAFCTVTRQAIEQAIELEEAGEPWSGFGMGYSDIRAFATCVEKLVPEGRRHPGPRPGDLSAVFILGERCGERPRPCVAGAGPLRERLGALGDTALAMPEDWGRHHAPAALHQPMVLLERFPESYICVDLQVELRAGAREEMCLAPSRMSRHTAPELFRLCTWHLHPEEQQARTAEFKQLYAALVHEVDQICPAAAQRGASLMGDLRHFLRVLQSIPDTPWPPEDGR